MTPKKHASHPMKWETSKADVEGMKYGKEGSRKEEAFDRKQAPKLPKQK
jgi:hypothetical protein